MTDSTADRLPRSIAIYNVALCIGAAVAVYAGRDTNSVVHEAWALVYVPLVVLAEYLVIRIRFRSRREINALNLVDAVLAPLIAMFSAPAVVAVVVTAQVVAAVRRNDLVRGWFNTAQWALAAGAGSLTFSALSDNRAFDGRNALALLTALAVVGAVNQTAFAIVVTLAHRQPLRNIVSALGPTAWRQWFLGWVVNTTFGLLFASALSVGPAAAVLFVVPLLALHAAYRDHAAMAASRSRLERLHAASRALAAPVDPSRAIPQFLAEVGRCYRTEAVDLVLLEDGERILHRYREETAPPRPVDAAADRLLTALVDRGRTVKLSGSRRGALDILRVDAGWQEVIASPLVEGDEMIGLLCVYNPTGLEGDGRDELTILDTLTREAAATIQKGRAVQNTLEERALLASLVGNASDGILTIGADGTIRSWNPGLAHITGWTAEDMIGRRGLDRVRPCDHLGQVVELESWRAGGHFPQEIQITARDGTARSLECSYGIISAREAGDDTMVIIARDVTGAREVARLQAEVGRLTKLEAAQRQFVNQLQDAVRPERPNVAGVQMAVEYLPSDPSAPSGGDLYDWQVLPDGDLHLAVVDVLGHGIGATKNAVTVTHVLRILALEGCRLEDLMARAETVLAAQASGLVATALVARYRPTTGELRMVGAGHPPALVVRDGGRVEQVSARGIPLGWPGAGSEAVVELVLETHDILVLYTDGLIEATRDIIAGLEALEAAAAEMRTLPVTELVRQLVARSLAGGLRRDDSLALVVRRASADDAGFDFTLSNDPAAVRRLRRALVEWLEDAQRSPESIDALTLVASELATNAVRAGATRTTVRARVEGDIEILEVEDDGPGFLALDDPALPSDALADRGRGLYISRSLVEGLEVEPVEGGTLVRARRRVRRPAELS